MTPRQFWRKYRQDNFDHIKTVCKAANVDREHFKNVALHGGSIGRFKARDLCKASGGEMTILEILYQDDYERGDAA